MSEMFDANQQKSIPMIRGHRIVRMSEKRIGPFALDSGTAEMLDDNNAGVLIGDCPGGDWMFEKMQQLSRAPEPEPLLVLLTSYSLADKFYRQTEGSNSKRPDFWKQGALTLTTPGYLKKLAEQITPDYSAIIVIDPRTRLALPDSRRSRWNNGGLPRQIAKYRHSCAIQQRRPPLVLLTCDRAKGLNTSQMLAPLALDTWWFVDGKSVRIGKPPQQKKKPDSFPMSIY